jgi:oxygen-independent coproporphyrinogen-3 oxidase
LFPRHVYVHVPFCARRCAYCDFSIAVRNVVPVGDYIAAIRTELRLRFGRDESWEVDTLYLGGGTPSRLGADGVSRLLAVVRDRVALSDGAEVTLEVNPEDASREAATQWRAAGVNRVSLGVQSFDDRALAWMRRTHDAAGAAAAVDAVRAAGIDNVSLDLIFALPAMLRRSWEADLDRATALAPPHVSLYGLTVGSIVEK